MCGALWPINAMPPPCYRHATAMLPPCYRHATAMPPPRPRQAPPLPLTLYPCASKHHHLAVGGTGCSQRCRLALPVPRVLPGAGVAGWAVGSGPGGVHAGARLAAAPSASALSIWVQHGACSGGQQSGQVSAGRPCPVAAGMWAILLAFLHSLWLQGGGGWRGGGGQLDCTPQTQLLRGMHSMLSGLHQRSQGATLTDGCAGLCARYSPRAATARR